MKTYRIYSTSGKTIGLFEADSEREALEKYADEQAYTLGKEYPVSLGMAYDSEEYTDYLIGDAKAEEAAADELSA